MGTFLILMLIQGQTDLFALEFSILEIEKTIYEAYFKCACQKALCWRFYQLGEIVAKKLLYQFRCSFVNILNEQDLLN